MLPGGKAALETLLYTIRDMAPKFYKQDFISNSELLAIPCVKY